MYTEDNFSQRNQAAERGGTQVQKVVLFRGFSKDRSKGIEFLQGAALVCLPFSHFVIYCSSHLWVCFDRRSLKGRGGGGESLNCYWFFICKIELITLTFLIELLCGLINNRRIL